MLRADEHRRKVRDGHRVSVPHCAEHPTQAWRGQGHVHRVPARVGQTDCGSGEVWTDFPPLRRGCGPLATAILAAVSGEQTGSRHHATPSRDGTSADRGGRASAGGLDREAETQRATWINSPCYLGATGPTRRTPVRVPRPGTTRPLHRFWWWRFVSLCIGKSMIVL